MIGQAQIVGALRTLGVAPGDTLLCHNSYKSFGEEVEAGPEGVCAALMTAVGPLGNLFMPTFNFAELPWKPGETRSLTGVITDKFWRLPGVQRSLHPTHPVAGHGPRAVEILAGHEGTYPFGHQSPIWCLWQTNAWVLLIGVEHSSNSTIHVAEEHYALPYVTRTRVQRVWGSGEWTETTVRRPGDSNGFVKAGPVLEQMGAVRECHVGRSRFRLMRSSDIVRAVGELVTTDKAGLLCNDPKCDRCNEARTMIAVAGQPPSNPR